VITRVLCTFRLVFCDGSIILAHVHGCGWIRSITRLSSLVALRPRNAGDTGVVPTSQLPRPLSDGVRSAGPSAESRRFTADECSAGSPAGLRATVGPRWTRQRAVHPGHVDVDTADVSHTFDGLLRLAAVVGHDRKRVGS